jgi:putative transposase
VKYEEIHLKAYESVGQARQSIANCLTWYNQQRPHSSLLDKTPDEAYSRRCRICGVVAGCDLDCCVVNGCEKRCAIGQVIKLVMPPKVQHRRMLREQPLILAKVHTDSRSVRCFISLLVTSAPSKMFPARGVI